MIKNIPIRYNMCGCCWLKIKAIFILITNLGYKYRGIILLKNEI